MPKLDPCDLICAHPQEINPNKVRDISDSIRRKDYLPNEEIRVYRLDGKWIVIDGNHRAIAACKRGVYPIPSEELSRPELYTDQELRNSVLSRPITIGEVADRI